jgi:hypothetical protein
MISVVSSVPFLFILSELILPQFREKSKYLYSLASFANIMRCPYRGKIKQKKSPFCGLSCFSLFFHTLVRPGASNFFRVFAILFPCIYPKK